MSSRSSDADALAVFVHFSDRLFPRKRVGGSRRDAFVEQRRTGLERWLSELLMSPRLASHPLVEAFLGTYPNSTTGGAGGMVI